MFGIRLKPESLITLFRIPVSLLVNTVIDAEYILGNSAKAMCEEMTGVFDLKSLIQIAEKHLMARLRNVSLTPNYVVEACRLIRSAKGISSIEAISKKLYVSTRQIERCFKEQFGVSPKTYQRIIRFRNAYSQVRRRQHNRMKWTDISYSSGYADQAHFIRDFKSFTGANPTSMAENTDAFFQTLEVSSLLPAG
jgi:AraC-like DNA-binding protein